jgi:hypothetical protein
MTMTDRKDALIKLLDEIELGNVAPFAPFVERIISKFSQGEIDLIQKANHGSLDAAKALHEAVLHEAVCVSMTYTFRYNGESMVMLSHHGQRWAGVGNPARAWLIALLKALIAGENTNANDKGE